MNRRRDFDNALEEAFREGNIDLAKNIAEEYFKADHCITRTFMVVDGKCYSIERDLEGKVVLLVEA